MVQQIVSAFIATLKTVGDTLMRLAPAIALALGALAIAATLMWAADREGFRTRVTSAGMTLRRSAGWLAVAMLVSVLWLVLQKIGPIVGEEQYRERQVQYTTREDPSLSGVYQYGPIAGFVQEKTFTRTLTLPPAFLDRIGAEGVQTLSPYLQDPSAENVLKLADTFRKSGQDVIFTREVTRLEETPIPFSSADVKVKLEFKDTGAASRKSFYDAHYDSTYTFKNPLAQPATCRFRFSLPQAGTIRGLSISVKGTPVGEPDEQGAYGWEGTLQPGATATANVKYSTQGGGDWRYDIGSGHRRIESFTLTVDADEPARFLRGALYPTKRDGNRMVWQLENVITNQHVDLHFPGHGADQESRAKALGFLPISLAMLLGGIALYSWRLRRALEPGTVALATVGFTIGLGATAILLLYMPLLPATLIATTVGTGLAVQVLGLRYIAPVGLAAALPLVFVSDLHSGLIAIFSLALAFVTLMPRRDPSTG
jgi:hypothetical protein